jgi:GntR family transcriptional repressor for pyruvate dehydrogenase complex
MARLSPAAATAARDVLGEPLEVRRIIEPETAALAAARAGGAALGDMERWLQGMEDAIRDGRSAIEYDSGFHVAIAHATTNAMLIELVGALTEALQASRERSFRPTEAATRALADHRAILDAIRAGDAAAARDAMRTHLDHVEELIRSTIAAADTTT